MPWSRRLPARFVPTRVLALAVATASVPAAAATTWLCGLSGDGVQLICIADDDPRSTLSEIAATETPPGRLPAANTTVRGTRFPLDPAQRWVVDLWSPPTEPERVAELAQATICYRSPGCRVVMAEAPPIEARWAPARRTRVARAAP